MDQQRDVDRPDHASTAAALGRRRSVRDPIRNGLDRPAAVALTTVLVLSLAHHADHVLRADHSGWPFQPDVTVFTYSLLVYPVLLLALLGPRRLYWLRWALVLGGATFLLLAHTVVETPADQFGTWAGTHAEQPDSSDHGAASPLVAARSPLLGAASVALGLALNVAAVVTTALMLRAGLRLRRGQCASSVTSG